MRMAELREAVAVALFGNAWHDGAEKRGCEMGTADSRTRQTTLYVCREGALMLVDANGDIALPAGAACIVPAGEAPGVFCGTGTSFARVELGLDPLADLMPELGLPALALARFAHGSNEATVLAGFYNDDLRILIKRISWELGAANERHLLTLRGMVGDLVLSIEHALADRRSGGLRIDSVLAYLNETLATATLRGTAEHFYCHPNSIANLIKRELGTTFGELVTSLRIDRARLLFEVDGPSVQEVALACGYRNMTHFYEVFRNRCGMSPGAYRRAVARRAS